VFALSVVALCQCDLSESDVETVDGVYLRTAKDRHAPNPVLECGVSRNESFKFQWLRPRQSEDKHFTVSNTDTNSVLNFSRVGQADIGTWRCIVTDSQGLNVSKEVNLFSLPQAMPLPRSYNRVEGEEVELQCEVYGWPMPTLSWRRGDQPLNTSDDRVSIINGTLKIVNLRLEDRADYICVASSTYNNTEYEDTSSTLVRVKDNLAPLWPFLGILFEIVILAVIIVSYECYRRNKKSEDEKNL